MDNGTATFWVMNVAKNDTLAFAGGFEQGKRVCFREDADNAKAKGPDAEGITVGGSGMVYLASERDNSAKGVNCNMILMVNPNESGTRLVAQKQWDLAATLPQVSANMGIEAVEWVANGDVAGKLIDQNTGSAFDAAKYPNAVAGGVFFAALEDNGHVYAYVLNKDETVVQIADIDAKLGGAMALDYDTYEGVLWVAANDGYGNRMARITLNGTSDPNVVHVQPAAGVNTSANNEGFAIAGAEYTVSGQRPVYRFCGGVTSGALTIGSMSCNYTASGSGAHHYYPNAAINSPATGDSGAAAKYNGAASGCAVILYSTILLRCVLCRAAGKEKVRQFSRPKAGHSIIKGSKNHCIESKNGSIQLPNSSLFEIHGSIFKPRPSRNPGQTSVVCITHGVLSFCIGKNTLYGLFSYVIELLATFDFSQFFDQIEIFLPDMSCAYPLSAFICATSSFVGTVFADFGRTAASPFPFFACGRMPRPIPHCR